MEMNKGPYFAYEIIEDEISFGFNIGLHYLDDGQKDFQISIVILDISVAVGWMF